ncbi:unnamed protein product, partial [Mesorhabditis spiculigera]
MSVGENSTDTENQKIVQPGLEYAAPEDIDRKVEVTSPQGEDEGPEFPNDECGDTKKGLAKSPTKQEAAALDARLPEVPDTPLFESATAATTEVVPDDHIKPVTQQILNPMAAADRLMHITLDGVIYIVYHRQTRNGSGYEKEMGSKIEKLLNEIIQGKPNVLFFGDFNMNATNWETFDASEEVRGKSTAPTFLAQLKEFGFCREWVREPTRVCKKGQPAQLDVLLSRRMDGGAPNGVQPKGKCSVVRYAGSDHKALFFSIIKENAWHVETDPFLIALIADDCTEKFVYLKIYNKASSHITLNIRHRCQTDVKISYYYEEPGSQGEPANVPIATGTNFRIEGGKSHQIKICFSVRATPEFGMSTFDWIILQNADTEEEHHVRVVYTVASTAAEAT